jgi:putative ABC transport system permease protein
MRKTGTSTGGHGLFPRILWGSLWRRRARLAIAISAVAIGASVVAGLMLVSRDVERQVSRELKSFGPNLMIVPAAQETRSGVRDIELAPVYSRSSFPEPASGDLAAPAPNDAPVELEIVLPTVYGAAHVGLGAFGRETVLVTGTDLAGLLRIYDGWQRAPADEPLPTNRVPALCGRTAADRLGAQPGDTLTLRPLVEHGDKLPIVIAEIFDAGSAEDDALYLPLDDAQRLLAMPGRVNLILARAAGVPRDIESAVEAGWLATGERNVSLIRRMSSAEQSVLGRLGILLGAIIVLALAAATLCAWSTLTDLVLERRREVALLKSLGAGRRQILALFLAEAAVLGLTGGAAGIFIGVVAAQVIGQSVFATMIRFDPVVLPAVLGLSLVVSLAASFLPVRMALAVQPAGLLRGE